MIDYLGMVKEFHEKYNHYIGKCGYWPPAEISQLRDKLIDEESKEFQSASSQIDIADAIADLLYVTFGAALAYGIPIEEVFAEVHRSNMTKSTKTNIIGKTVKGPDWEPPDIGGILKNATK